MLLHFGTSAEEITTIITVLNIFTSQRTLFLSIWFRLHLAACLNGLNLWLCHMTYIMWH